MYDAISREEVISFLKLYGCNATSYLTLQEGMSYHYVQNAGYIAYKRIRNKVFALGNPVCSPGHYQEIIDRFLYNYPSARFIQVNAEFRDILVNEFGYYGTAMGVETLLPGSWNLTGRKKQNIRTAINTVRKEGILVKENNQEVNYSGLMDNWLRTRKVKSKEICFLVRPSKMHSPQTRRFFAYKDNRLMGMMFFDPLYMDGCVFGYIPNICMSSEEFKQGIYYDLAFQGFTSFSRERKKCGLPVLNLGLSPLKPTEKCSSESAWLRMIMRMLYRHGNALYNFKGMAFMKSRFLGEEKPVYYMHKSPLPLIDVYNIFKLSNIL